MRTIRRSTSARAWSTAVELLARLDPAMQPQPLNHAKLAGTRLTACGLDTATWPRMWVVPFFRAPGRRCPMCSELLN
jgi:hypothetical protein